MDAQEYRAALATLGLSQLAAGRWLGVSPKTAQNYASKGPSGPAAVAVRMALRHGLDWPEELAAKTRWIGKDEALAMYPMDNGDE